MSSGCSVCQRQHEDGGEGEYGGDCDHWCHDAGAEDWEVPGE